MSRRCEELKWARLLQTTGPNKDETPLGRMRDQMAGIEDIVRGITRGELPSRLSESAHYQLRNLGDIFATTDWYDLINSPKTANRNTPKSNRNRLVKELVLCKHLGPVRLRHMRWPRGLGLCGPDGRTPVLAVMSPPIELHHTKGGDIGGPNPVQLGRFEVLVVPRSDGTYHLTIDPVEPNFAVTNGSRTFPHPHAHTVYLPSETSDAYYSMCWGNSGADKAAQERQVSAAVAKAMTALWTYNAKSPYFMLPRWYGKADECVQCLGAAHSFHTCGLCAARGCDVCVSVMCLCGRCRFHPLCAEQYRAARPFMTEGMECGSDCKNRAQAQRGTAT